RFLALNGIQTQSAHTFNLLSELDGIRALDVDVLRISPQANHTARVIELFRQALDGRVEPGEASQKLERLLPVGSCNGYWHGEAGMENRAQAAAQALC
ncbi:MAG: U32 family peptidase, partial [Sedimenticola sp.]|nr:U32 family peptidase [Sedimenticola sp.]